MEQVESKGTETPGADGRERSEAGKAPEGTAREPVSEYSDNDRARSNGRPEGNPNAYINHEWITDEGLLRDEGVLCGLSGVDPGHKVNAIQAYFDDLILTNQARRERLQALMDGVRRERAERSERISEKEEEARKIEVGQHEHPVIPAIRLSVGLGLSLAICVSQYFLLEYLLRDAVPSPRLVSLALFLTGMFGQYTFFSVLFSDGRQEDDPAHADWKRLLLEIGMPAMSALLAGTLLLPTMPMGLALVHFLFILLSFLFAGKLLLSNIALLQRRVQQHREQGARKSVGAVQAGQLREDKATLNQEIESLDRQVQDIGKQLATLESEQALRKRQALAVETFLSEYRLSYDYRYKNR